LTGNENSLNFADTAGSCATVMCCRGALNIGQTLKGCLTARTKECRNP